MKVGDYIRTKRGLICRIININEFREPSLKYGVEANYLPDVMFTGDEDIKKSSSKLKDLIEVGDFIGKTIVEEVKEFDDGTRIIVMADGFDEYDENEYFLKAGIVTKEQFESMEYKVVE